MSEPQPIHSLRQRESVGFADRLLLPLWIVTLAGYLIWLLTLGVNV